MSKIAIAYASTMIYVNVSISRVSSKGSQWTPCTVSISIDDSL